MSRLEGVYISQFRPARCYREYATDEMRLGSTFPMELARDLRQSVGFLNPSTWFRRALYEYEITDHTLGRDRGTMSFGRPGGLRDTFKVTPPQRGSFPLDHDGEFTSPPSPAQVCCAPVLGASHT